MSLSAPADAAEPEVMTHTYAKGILGTNIAGQVQRLEGVVAVRDRFTYPAPARVH